VHGRCRHHLAGFMLALFSNVAVTGGVIAILALALSPLRWH
jgi:hypothetical protein